MSSDMRILYVVYCGVAVTVLKEFNAVVTEPYMVIIIKFNFVSLASRRIHLSDDDLG
jgi:hypothetical protein